MEKLIDVEDIILVKQTKYTIKPPFDPARFKVIEVSENNATLQRGSKNIKRSFNQLKIVKKATSQREKRVS